MRRNPQFLTVLAFVLVFLGFGRMFAWIIHSDPLDEVMFRGGISPLAIAFSHRSGHEDFVMEGTLGFYGENGELLSTLQLTAEDMKKIPGSLSKKGVLLISSLYAPRFDAEEVKNAIVGLGCPLVPKTSRIHLGLNSRKDQGWHYERDLICALH